MVKPNWKTLLGGAGTWRSIRDGTRRHGCADQNRRMNGLIWQKNLGHHLHGEFSMAMVQANASMEDQVRFESGPLSSVHVGLCGTFVGVYDGHGGPDASLFVNERLFTNLTQFASENQQMSLEVIKRAFLATEEELLSLVRQERFTNPQMATVGTCCLVGLICDGLLYIANAGDSRAVLGRADKAGEITAVQLSTEHNANVESVRDELRALHPNDSNIVVLKHNVWRVKGLVQVSRSIGDAYLKSSEFNGESLLPKFRLPEEFHKPILSPEPSILVHKIDCVDQFVIFASDGLWEHLSNQEAVDTVNRHPRHGVASRLVEAALRVAAKKREMRYSDLRKIDRGVRRHFHDDITVVVVFMDGSCGSNSVVSVRTGDRGKCPLFC